MKFLLCVTVPPIQINKESASVKTREKLYDQNTSNLNNTHLIWLTLTAKAWVSLFTRVSKGSLQGQRGDDVNDCSCQ